MRRALLLLFCLLLSLFSIHAEQIKLLAIGNSFSDDAIEHYLYGLAEAAGDTIIIGNMYIGGCSLETHFNNSQNNSNSYSYRKIVNGEKTETPDFNLIDAIIDEDWDYISFQQVSSLSGVYETYFPYLDDLIKFAESHSTNSDVQFVLHSTWAYAQSSTHSGFSNYDYYQADMYNAIIDASYRAAEKAGIKIVIPAGTAIQNGRTSSLGDTFCRDGYHLELTYGRYTASCAWYEKLFGKPVLGNSYIPFTIDPFQARVAQLAAHKAVINPTSVTPIRIKEGAWRTIEPLFTPPKEYENTLHGYRSPLQFNDGTPVKDNNDWTERRNEIRETWLSITDEWPPILEDQQFEIIDQEKREDFTQYTVRFKWTQNDYTEGYLFIPDKKGKMPAVITVGDKENRDFANQLTKRGFVTLSFGTIETTGTTENKTAEVRHLSSLAYSAANAYEALAKVDVVDPKRIGIVGHSYGGKWAMFASSLYDKFATAVWIDSGIHELHALMAPRPFLVSGGSTDPAEQWIPLNHTIAVNNLLEYKHRVAVSKGSNETVYSFLEWFLEY